MPTLITSAVTFVAGQLVAAGLSQAAAFAIANLGVSALLTAASRALVGGNVARQQDIQRELAQDNTAPVWRYVYGRARVPGSPIAYPVSGEKMIACWLLNSRPSEGEFTLFLDERAVTLTGDAYDLSGPGATATNEPFSGHINVWFATGGQTAPPDDVLTAGVHGSGDNDRFFKASDGGQGRTLMWAILDAGDAEERVDRWPSAPPQVRVEGKWSLVWDPRDSGQSGSDASTWVWNNNQALCALDLLRQNPFRPYRNRHLMLDQWRDAADIAGEQVDLKAGGTEKRYRVGGIVTLDGGEIEDLIAPLMLAGASELIRTGGRLGIAPGAHQAPVYAATDLLSFGSYQTLAPVDDLPTQMRGTYTSRSRGYETAELPPWDIPGAESADGVPAVQSLSLDLVTSHTQAQRVRRIVGRRARRQKRLSGVFPPSAFSLIAGSTVLCGFPAPYDRMNGTYRVTSIAPAFDLVGDSGVAMRCQVTLIETDQSDYDWLPGVDEQDISDGAGVFRRRKPSAPGAITATTGAGIDLDTGGTIIPRIRFAFDPASSRQVIAYEWQFRPEGSAGVWREGGVISTASIGGDSKVFGYVSEIDPSKVYDIRVRGTGIVATDWVTLLNVSIAFEVTNVVTTPGVMSLNVTGTAPAGGNCDRVRLYRTAGTTFDTNERIGTEGVERGADFDVDFTPPTGTANFWIVPVSITGQEGTPDGPHNETILM